jgi:tetratricopeptide (TPR) repeat protein
MQQDLLSQAFGFNSMRFSNSIIQLTELFVIDHIYDSVPSSFSMHPLTKNYIDAMPDCFIALDSFYLTCSEYYLNSLKEYAGRNNWLGYEGYDEIDKNKSNILYLRKWCFENAYWDFVINFQDLLSRYLYIRGYWKERLKFGEECLFAAEQTKNRIVKGLCLSEDIGYMLHKLGDNSMASNTIQKGVEILLSEGDFLNASRSYIRLSSICVENSQEKEAIKYSKIAIDSANKISNRSDAQRMIAVVEEHLSNIYIEAQNWDAARKSLLFSEKVFKEQGDKLRLARVLYYLGVVIFSQGAISEAKLRFEQAMDLSKSISRKDYEYLAQMMLAKVEKLEGNADRALTLIKQAQDGFVSLGAPKFLLKATEIEREILNNP